MKACEHPKICCPSTGAYIDPILIRSEYKPRSFLGSVTFVCSLKPREPTKPLILVNPNSGPSLKLAAFILSSRVISDSLVPFN